ncbi:hypothetical protein BGY98DRAFT_143689 [Russula aff. rugulosa BPL654]|nr:hypothetical protein BGY98DRAFT_143689 [Russula aff. rugulosa BPL654]
MDTRSLNSSHVYRTPPKNLVFIPSLTTLTTLVWDRAPFSSLRFFFSSSRGQVPHSLYLPFLHCYLSLGQSESYVCYSIPTSTLFNLSCHPEMNTKSFIALTFLALASSVIAVPAPLRRPPAHSAPLTKIPTQPINIPDHKNLSGNAAVVDALKRLSLASL